MFIVGARDSAYFQCTFSDSALLLIVFFASDTEPGEEPIPEFGKITHPFLLALHDQLRFAGQLTLIHLLILSRASLARIIERTLPPLVQCNMDLRTG